MFEPISTALILAKFLAYYWWIYIPVLLFFVWKSVWIYYLEGLYESKNKKVLLEIRIPREVRKSPKAMEQFLCNIYGTKSGRGFVEKWWKGKKVLKFSLEIISLGGEVHFYIRTAEKFKDLVEANLYAQYIDVEVVEVSEEDDYINELPDTMDGLYNLGYNLFGNELILKKPDVYPIRTYLEFESMEEEKSLDPVSVLLEILTKARSEERVWVQILIVPAGSEWKEEARDVIKRIREEAKTREDIGDGRFITSTMLSPGQKDIMEAVERNVSKVGFYTTIRYLYMAPKDIFKPTTIKKGVASAFNQYGSQNLNSFAGNSRKDTDRFMYFFRKTRAEARKRKLLLDYRTRNMKEPTFMGELITSHPFHLSYSTKPFILNVEELATIYHLPTYIILTATMIKRVESKKIGPPAGLSIYGEEE